ncbi:unnamed protein product [Parnassius apollo]|uniref:(apollo) hypothetical protein n=1 Tax=Parnassius apollo TaxID=110799 RepID=A0A8S3WL80_PARAO|nr:unnamed protein product [Parnassius apollo]
MPLFSKENTAVEKSTGIEQNSNPRQEKKKSSRPEASGCEMDKNVNLSDSMTPLSSELDSIFDSPKKGFTTETTKKKDLFATKTQ